MGLLGNVPGAIYGYVFQVLYYLTDSISQGMIGGDMPRVRVQRNVFFSFPGRCSTDAVT
jgi:hypothetical protein